MSISQENHHFLKATELTQHHCTTQTQLMCHCLILWILIPMC